MRRSIGELLKSARIKRRISLADIEQETKIKRKFLKALEKSQWNKLPDFATSLGFAKVYARTVGLDPSYIAALFRRDFSRQDTQENRKLDFNISGITWTPKATLVTVFLLALIIVGGYLVHQYTIFVAPPPLTVLVEKKGDEIKIQGHTRPTATVTIEDKEVIVDEKGYFNSVLPIAEIGNFLDIKARSRSGKETTFKKALDSL